VTVQQALDYFDIKKIGAKLQAMSDVGLDYLVLGQPLSTLSGGECQRIKLAGELHKKGSVYVIGFNPDLAGAGQLGRTARSAYGCP
jgi:excinuclease UvrABC ATPase subunit